MFTPLQGPTCPENTMNNCTMYCKQFNLLWTGFNLFEYFSIHSNTEYVPIMSDDFIHIRYDLEDSKAGSLKMVYQPFVKIQLSRLIELLYERRTSSIA